MPATLPRPREIAAPPFDGTDQIASMREDASAFAPPSRISDAPAAGDACAETHMAPGENHIEWREVAPLVDRFTNAMPEAERKRRRRLRRRHRNFVMSGVFWAGLLFGLELVGLVYLYSLDLTAVRAAAALDRDIQKTSLDIALAQNQLAASSSPAKLDAWAKQLGYHKAGLTEMDDVTGSTPPPPVVAVPAAQ